MAARRRQPRRRRRRGRATSTRIHGAILASGRAGCGAREAIEALGVETGCQIDSPRGLARGMNSYSRLPGKQRSCREIRNRSPSQDTGVGCRITGHSPSFPYRRELAGKASPADPLPPTTGRVERAEGAGDPRSQGRGVRRPSPNWWIRPGTTRHRSPGTSPGAGLGAGRAAHDGGSVSGDPVLYAALREAYPGSHCERAPGRGRECSTRSSRQ